MFAKCSVCAAALSSFVFSSETLLGITVPGRGCGGGDGSGGVRGGAVFLKHSAPVLPTTCLAGSRFSELNETLAPAHDNVRMRVTFSAIFIVFLDSCSLHQDPSNLPGVSEGHPNSFPEPVRPPAPSLPGCP